MECLNIHLKHSLISPNNDIYDTLTIKENIFSDENNLFASKNDINYLKLFEEEEEDEKEIKNNNDSMKSERETLTNSKKFFSKDLNKLNDFDLKRQLKLKRNRESSRNGRLRKKIFIQNLIKENTLLKNNFNYLINIIDKCPKCRENFEKISKKENDRIIGENENRLREEPKISNKRKFLFTTAIAIISIINIFNIPLNIINYYRSFYSNKIEYLRNLNDNLKLNYTLVEEYKKNENLLLSKLSTGNGNEEGLYIHLAEFYSMTKREKIPTNSFDPKKETDKNIQVFHENQFNIDQISYNNASECVKCVVELDKKSIKVGGDEFTFYLADRHLSKFFRNNNEDGIFPQLNYNEFTKKDMSKFFALKCKILAYSINDLYFEKI